MRIGLDIDGVLSEKKSVNSAKECSKAERSDFEVPSGHEVFLISARKADMREETEKWLDENDIQYRRLILYDGSAGKLDGLPAGKVDEKQATFKAIHINDLDLKVFVEDRPQVRRLLTKYCPNCAILSPDHGQKRIPGWS